MSIPAIVLETSAGAREGSAGETPASAVSWAAIIAGAAVAAAAALIMFTLGAGLGFAIMPTPTDRHPSATTFAVTSVIWLVVTQWLTAAIGGYVTGRLRTRWVNVHTHEVFFRDTAHGLVTWALGALLGATLALGAFGSMASAGMRGAGAMGAMAANAGPDDAMRYSIDSLLRPAAPSDNNGDGGDTANDYGQAARMLMHGIGQREMPTADRDYLAQWVAKRSGIPVEEARQRVDDTVTSMRQAADTARKAAAKTSVLTALSLLVGAFIACVAAALGGRLRDQYHAER